MMTSQLRKLYTSVSDVNTSVNGEYAVLLKEAVVTPSKRLLPAFTWRKAMTSLGQQSVVIVMAGNRTRDQRDAK
jgi:hypothetical protein